MCWIIIKQKRGTVVQVARALGISTAAVSQWRQVPAARRAAVAALLGLDISNLVESDGAPASATTDMPLRSRAA